MSQRKLEQQQQQKEEEGNWNIRIVQRPTSSRGSGCVMDLPLALLFMSLPFLLMLYNPPLLLPYDYHFREHFRKRKTIRNIFLHLIIKVTFSELFRLRISVAAQKYDSQHLTVQRK